jgi:hypothetical protein
LDEYFFPPAEIQLSLFSVVQQLLIRRRALYMVNDKDLDRGLTRFEFQPKLLPKGRKD